MPETIPDQVAPRPDINYALVEDTRPPIYTAMKYWGKKPHNIWAQFIERYCPVGGVLLDPFAGSGISAFESARIGRKAIAFDLNPLTAFTIEVLSSKFNEQEFTSAVDRIGSVIENDEVYKQHFTRTIDGQPFTILNYKWDGHDISKVALQSAAGERSVILGNAYEKANVEQMSNIPLPYWHPTVRFPKNPSISHKFIADIGGETFEHLWTRRNLYLLSKIYDQIIAQQDKSVKLQLLFGFLQSLHLTSKMVVPRNETSNREYSGSWGRADYMIRRRSMEQNPLDVFRRSCFGKQSVSSALRHAKTYLPSDLKIADVLTNKKLKTASINYGTVDVADLSRYVSPKSVDFIITDPPYAGLVQYLDLSLVWLVWLQKLDKKYFPDIRSEITVKDEFTDREEYRRRLRNAFTQMHQVLKDDGKLVVTFHHDKLQEWNDFVQAVKTSGFKFDKVTHQYNKRSGEANVANPYGTSGSDFYIRCVKQRDVDFTDDQSGLEHFIVQKVIEIIAKRAEPTPYNLIIDGLIPELVQAGFVGPQQYKNEVSRVLANNEGAGKIFSKTNNAENKAGDYWWFIDASQHINFPDRPLKDRVDETVLSLLRRKVSVRYDDVLSELFRMYPNGLTPDPKGIVQVLGKYAYKSAENWKINEVALRLSTEHTRLIEQLILIGKKTDFNVYVGRREQPEICGDGSRLVDKSDLRNLQRLDTLYSQQQIERIEMIDTIWLGPTNDKIECIFEVENTTGFMSAIQRASNLDKNVQKFMVIPLHREAELRTVVDPLFVTSFLENNWKYITYDAVDMMARFSTPSMQEFLRISKTLK